MTIRISGLTWVVLSSALVSCVTPPEPRAERDPQFRTIFDSHDHDSIVASALPFLRINVLARLGDINESTDDGDTQFQSRYHVDNCRVEEAFSVIEEHYELAVLAADPEALALSDVETNFGRILHTVQDFYAHSNWVESEQPQIVTENTFRWPSGAPGTPLGSMIVLHDSLELESLQRASGSRVPTFVLDGEERMGFMTSTYADNEDTSVCPPSVALPHGRHVLPNWPNDYDQYLAKDAPTSAHHDHAVEYALDQTTEELCRLIRLIDLRYGDEGSAPIREAWVADETRFEAACPNNASLLTSVRMAAIGS